MASLELKDTPASTVPPAQAVKAENAEEPNPKRGLRFWLVYVALCLSILLAALDLVRLKTPQKRELFV